MSSPQLAQLQKQTQQLLIAPQMRQALKILQVGALELRSTILEELQTNPALEEMASNDLSLESPDSPNETKEGDMGMDDWDDGFTQSEQYSSDQAARRQFFFDSITAEDSLQEHLMRQAELTEAKEEVIHALEYIIGSLDDRGFLSNPAETIAEQADVELSVVEEALALLKTLEPVGLGCKDLQESLLTQLRLQGNEENALAIEILEKHFPLFLRRRIPELSKALGIIPEDIEETLGVIAQLDPAPGRRFAEDTNRMVTPDVVIYKEADGWKLELTRDYLPRLRLSSNFKTYLADKRLSGSEKEFLQEKLKAGKQLISSIEQRQATIEKIARLILEIQEGFFEHGVEKLKPLTMAQIAQLVGVHETTISRAIANKYMATPHGLFPLKFFFTPGYTNGDGETISNKTIKDKIAAIIADENPAKPTSDQAIAEMLKKEDLKVARRTVAKYREELGILPTHLRRQFS